MPPNSTKTIIGALALLWIVTVMVAYRAHETRDAILEEVRVLSAQIAGCASQDTAKAIEKRLGALESTPGLTTGTIVPRR